MPVHPGQGKLHVGIEEQEAKSESDDCSIVISAEGCFGSYSKLVVRDGLDSRR